MLPYASFDGHEAAHFMYIKGCSGADAVEVLDRRLADDTWRRAPGAWFELLRWLDWKKILDTAEVDKRALAFASAVGAPPVDRTVPRFTEDLRDALGAFVMWSRDHDPHVLRALVDAVTTTAGPGEAGIIGYLLDLYPWVDPDGPMQGVAAWLLTKGVAELTNPARRQLMVRCLLLADEPAHLATAVRLLVRDGSSHAVQNAGPDNFQRLWDRIEQFDPSGPSSDEVLDLIDRLVAEVRWKEVFPNPERHPGCVRLLVRAWLRAPKRFQGVFDEVVLAAPPEPDDFHGVTLATLHEVVVHLRVSQGEPFHERADAERWTRLVSAALIKAAGGIAGVRRSAATRLSLRQMGGWPKPATGLVAALRDGVASGPLSPTTHLLTQILDDERVAVHFRASAAILAMEGDGDVAPAASEAALPPDFADHLLVLLNTPWRTTQGITAERVWRRARTIQLAALDRDLQVDLRDDVFLVHDGYPRMLAQSQRPAEDKLALLSLFVVHEAIHHAQNIGEKDAVGRLRATGNEFALMQLDLSADHAAALIVAAAVPRWNVLWLKDIQGRSIADFPATAMHPFGSRVRKAARVTGLRLDYLVRRYVAVQGIGEGFLFPAFAPTGGPFQVLTSGPPVTVLFERKVDPAQATTIMSALDRRLPPEPGTIQTDTPEVGDPIERLDRVLCDVLGVKR